MKKNNKVLQNKGITLIVLAITIVVILLLAGVSINLLIGDNGLLKEALNSKENTKNATIEEAVKLAIMASYDSNLNSKIDAVKEYITSQVDGVQVIEGEAFPLTLTMLDGKKYIIEENGNMTEAIEIKPILFDDMTPIYWDDDNNEIETNEDDNNWFNYDKAKWANAKTDDGSYWVWIPRFEYKITYTDESDYSMGGDIDIKIINTSKVVADDGYIIHPAFTDESSTDYANGGWNSEISGFWVAKFEISMEENKTHVETESSSIGNQPVSDTIKPVSKPNVTSWCNILPGNAFINSYNFDRSKESHMMKNSEWGAVAYLSYSKYGLDGTEICINTSNKTGQSTGMPKASTSDTNYAYDTTQGVAGSTTGNITGIYDMSGGLWEFMASYDSSDTSTKLTDNGLGYFVKDAKSTQYIMAYENEANNREDTYNLGKIGDAIKELRNNTSKKVSWYGDSIYIPYNRNPFSIRGGNNGSGSEAGIFCAGYNSGSASSNKSFRIVLVAY